ncbi:MAG: HEPN domain-containing protein [Candidatus Hydrogenedentota bacterium]
MNGELLAKEYLRKVKNRIEAVRLLFSRDAYDDVVRECQEIVELILKGMLRKLGIDPPLIHDVADTIRAYKNRLPSSWQKELDEISDLSKELSQERSQAFYGDEEDFTPLLELYDKDTAHNYIKRVEHLIALFEQALKEF